MDKKRPLLIVLTPVRNEAWVLKAFLKATSLWADYIIIADQMSTDGSRDLYEEYKKEQHSCQLVIIDNNRKEMHQAATRRLLFEEAKKIEGDKIVICLDADEFLSGDFVETESWQTILNSKPGEVFSFRWMNLSENITKYTTWQPYYWAAHLDDQLLDSFYTDDFIHESRLPWPENFKHEYIIEDICFIHFARVNANRQRNKERFYQVSQAAADQKYSGVRSYRSYHSLTDEEFFDVPQDAFLFYKKNKVDIISLLDLSDEGAHYTESVLNNFKLRGINYFRKLDIWDEEFLQRNKIKDPRRLIDKFMHCYLRKSNKYSNSFIIHAIDYIAKRFF